jgi:hypothetical protein
VQVLDSVPLVTWQTVSLPAWWDSWPFFSQCHAGFRQSLSKLMDRMKHTSVINWSNSCRRPSEKHHLCPAM